LQFQAAWNRRVIIRSFKTSGELKARRVVVTGLGVISPVGCSVYKAWNTIIQGGCGIVKLQDESYNN
jgi:3-oxoacyl-[acyl-carrier-protein] synthase II